MEDLIKRSDAIRQMSLMLEDISEDLSEQIMQRFGYDTAEELATEAMSIIPSADRPQGEWVPCSERLPNENEWVLCSCNNGCAILILKLKGKVWHKTESVEYLSKFVNAWMPLPEPMKGADDES